jgi:hypothetical protein
MIITVRSTDYGCVVVEGDFVYGNLETSVGV